MRGMGKYAKIVHKKFEIILTCLNRKCYKDFTMNLNEVQ